MKLDLSMPSLHRISLVSTAIAILKYECCLNFCSKWYINEKLDSELAIDDILGRADIISIPDSLRAELKVILEHIHMELFNWLKCLCEMSTCFKHLVENNKILNCINEIQWTAHGKIDHTKTAEAILKLKNLILTEKFVFALMFCIENTVDDFWKQMSDKDKKIIDVQVKELADVPILWQIHPVFRGVDFSKTSSDNDIKYDMLHKSIMKSNSAAVKYTWSLMPNEEKNYYFVNDFEDDVDFLEVETTYFLLSQMNEAQSHIVFASKERFSILEQLIWDWVYVEFFELILDKMYRSFTLHEFIGVLILVAGGCRAVKSDNKIKKCFRKIWIHASLEFRMQVGLYDVIFILENLCGDRDFENIELLIKGRCDLDRKMLLEESINLCVAENCDYLDWCSYELLVRKYLTKDSEIVGFKNFCIENIMVFAQYIINADNKRYRIMIHQFLKFAYSDQKDKIDNFKEKILPQLCKDESLLI